MSIYYFLFTNFQLFFLAQLIKNGSPRNKALSSNFERSEIGFDTARGSDQRTNRLSSDRPRNQSLDCKKLLGALQKIRLPPKRAQTSGNGFRGAERRACVDAYVAEWAWI